MQRCERNPCMIRRDFIWCRVLFRIDLTGIDRHVINDMAVDTGIEDDFHLPLSVEDRWNVIFRELRNTLSLPSDAHPAARVWKKSDLITAISEITKNHGQELTKTFAASHEILERIVEIGWLKLLPVILPPESKSTREIYLVDMEAAEDDQPDVAELLQGYQPSGFQCYFGALEFHELTNQPVAFYHIATLQEPIAKKEDANRVKSSSIRKPRKDPNPLGTFLFEYQGHPCYSTRRDRSLVPGIQQREIGPRTWLRVTTLEQTLLDTLMQPRRCGGEAVVFEAWEKGSQRWNMERIGEHLTSIGNSDLERRVGAMCSLLNLPVTNSKLRSLLDLRRESLRTKPAVPIPLLNGYSYPEILNEWGVLVP